MHLAFASVGAAGILFSASCACRAGTLQVAPVLVEIVAPAAASTLTLRNKGDSPLNAQVRVYRWSQNGSGDKLVETRDVVVSPPLLQIAAGGAQMVRIVRVSKAPYQGEESYRLLVDEIPNSAGRPGAAVTFAVRYSVPVYFSAPELQSARITWSIAERNGRVFVTGHNSGDRHIRIAALQVSTPSGRAISFGSGLIGYVLGRSAMQWSARGSLGNARTGDIVSISAETNNGPLKANGIVER